MAENLCKLQVSMNCILCLQSFICGSSSKCAPCNLCTFPHRLCRLLGIFRLCSILEQAQRVQRERDELLKSVRLLRCSRARRRAIQRSGCFLAEWSLVRMCILHYNRSTLLHSNPSWFLQWPSSAKRYTLLIAYKLERAKVPLFSVSFSWAYNCAKTSTQKISKINPLTLGQTELIDWS